MKKFLATLLAIVMILGTMPVLSLFSFAEPVKLGGYIKAAGWGFEYVNNDFAKWLIPYDFDLGGDPENPADYPDPEIVPATMADNLGDYTFTVTLTDDSNTVESHVVTQVQERGRWSTTDVGINFSLDDFTLSSFATYTVRIDIVTPGANEYYVEETDVEFNYASLDDLQDVTTGTLDNTNISWAFDKSNLTLTISGTGDMPDFAELADRPWDFAACYVEKIVIGEGITAVGKQTGARMKQLNEVEVAEGVTKLGMDVFAYCGRIEKVTIPSTLTYIGQGTLYSSTIGIVMCTLTREELRAQCTTIGNYNDSLFDAKWWYDPIWGLGINWDFNAETGTLTITGNGSMPNFDDFGGTRPWDEYKNDVTAVVIEEGITSIYSQAFNYMPNLDSVVLAETVTSIGGDAFAHCGTISSFTLSSNVTSISQGTVYDTTITTVTCLKDWNAIVEQATVGAYNDAYKNATWEGVEIYGHRLSFGKYGTGIENWQGNGDPNLTQILISELKWNGEYNADLLNVAWTLTVFPAVVDPEDPNPEAPVTMTLYPRSVYNGGTWAILRFVPALSSDPAGRFVPTKDKEYKITATVTLDGFTDTVTSKTTYKITTDPVLFDEYYNITWQLEGETEYVENVPAGFKPVYHGSAVAYEDDTYAYTPVVPATVEASEDATYNVTWSVQDKRIVTLGLWGSGYENWTGGTGGEQTQLLLRPKTYKNEDIPEAAKDYTWTITIDGVDYEGKVPSSHYSNWIFRFEPCLWSPKFVPEAGTSYEVGVAIYDGDTLLYYTAQPTTITIAEGFEAIVPPVNADINGDAEVNINDVTALLDILAGVALAPDGIDLDLSGNGVVEISDVTRLLDIIASL